jgi:hypothetical protein
MVRTLRLIATIVPHNPGFRGLPHNLSGFRGTPLFANFFYHRPSPVNYVTRFDQMEYRLTKVQTEGTVVFLLQYEIKKYENKD